MRVILGLIKEARIGMTVRINKQRGLLSVNMKLEMETLKGICPESDYINW